MIKNRIYKVEKIAYSWAVRTRYKIVITISVSAILIISSSIPYLNLLVSPQFAKTASFLLFLILFTSENLLVLMSMATILLALPLYLIEDFTSAEQLANLAFAIMLIATIRYIIKK